MDIPRLLLEGYLTFGILLTYTITFILGMLYGEWQTEKEILKNGEQIQSKKESTIYGTKFKIME